MLVTDLVTYSNYCNDCYKNYYNNGNYMTCNIFDRTSYYEKHVVITTCNNFQDFEFSSLFCVFSVTKETYAVNLFLSTVPAISPPNVSVTVLNDSALTVSWRPIEEILWQGLFLGYVVYFNHSGDDLHNTVSANTLELTITNLTAFTVYDVTVAGYTRKGLGPKSAMIRKQTHEESKKA